VTFVRERLSPTSYLGLHLTVGLAISAIFVWIFSGITEDILTRDPLVVVDQWVLNHILYFRTPAVTGILIIFTRLGSWQIIAIGSLVIITCLLFKKRIDELLSFIVAILGGNLLFLIFKMAIDRVIPIPETTFIKAVGWSFPSGHAVMSVIFYGMISYFLIRETRYWKLHVLTAMVSLSVVFLIDVSRIYLQVHYLSDVIAGYAGGLFRLTMCITGLEVYRKKQNHEPYRRNTNVFKE
jgi:undecaprenyl-diphosphatase